MLQADATVIYIYSDSTYYLVEAPLAALQPQVFLDMKQQTLHTWIGGFFCHSLLQNPLKLVQAGWEPFMENHFQVFDKV